jgi:hypothetical protein
MHTDSEVYAIVCYMFINICISVGFVYESIILKYEILRSHCGEYKVAVFNNMILCSLVDTVFT